MEDCEHVMLLVKCKKFKKVTTGLQNCTKWYVWIDVDVYMQKIALTWIDKMILSQGQFPQEVLLKAADR